VKTAEDISRFLVNFCELGISQSFTVVGVSQATFLSLEIEKG